MQPILFHLGDVAIASYGFALATGFALGIALAAFRARRHGLDPVAVLDLSIWIIVAALAGSRLFYVATHLEQFRPPHGSWIDVALPFHHEGPIRVAGLSVMGGLPAAVLVAALVLHWKRLPALSYMDLLSPSVALGAAITRVGCLLNGCCFGRPCSGPLCLRFPAGSLPFETLGDVPVHPTQLYQSLAALGILVALLLLERRRHAAGVVFAWLVTLMGGQRMLVEVLRHSPDGELLLRADPLTVSIDQVVALALVVGGVTMLRAFRH